MPTPDLRIQVIGDIHWNQEKLQRILDSTGQETFNATLLTGDIFADNLGPFLSVNPFQFNQEILAPNTRTVLNEEIDRFLSGLASQTSTAYLVPGNRDFPCIQSRYTNIINIDLIGCGKLANLGTYLLVGIGGSNWINGTWPYEWDDNKMFDRLASLLEPLSGKNLILLSHCPPYNCKLDIENKHHRHIGSHAVRKAIDLYQPILCVCGHVHESLGVDVLGKTIVVNSGSIVPDDNVMRTLSADHGKTKPDLVLFSTIVISNNIQVCFKSINAEGYVYPVREFHFAFFDLS